MSAQATCITVERDGTEHARRLVGVGENWFTSSFSVAVGSSMSEALERFHADLSALLDTYTEDVITNADAAVRLRNGVTNVMYRLSVAAEWAERVERLELAREASR